MALTTMDVINHSLQNPHQKPPGSPELVTPPSPKAYVQVPDAPRKSRPASSRVGRADRCKMEEKYPTIEDSADYIPLTQAPSIKNKVDRSKDWNRIRSRSSSPLLCRQHLSTDDEDTVDYPDHLNTHETVYTRPTHASSPISTKYPSSEKLADISRTASDED